MGKNAKNIATHEVAAAVRRPGFAALIAVTIFLGAFLLFQVQPLVGRFLLPWFGGSPEVWTTCMLFFQLFLLAGYGWAHLCIRFLTPRRQSLAQIGLLVIAAVTLSVVPADSLKPSPTDNPILKILLICAASVGLPYFLLSTTGPVLQSWFARLLPGQSPYRLYALSNAGSLLALVSFPFFFEPHFTRLAIGRFWSAGFLVYAGLYAAVAMIQWKSSPAATLASKSEPLKPAAKISRSLFWLWIALPACASVELLAVTTKITQDIAVIPFLWIAPLSLYLLSFIICFDHPRWYVRPVFLILFMAGIIGVIIARNFEENLGVGTLIGLYLAMLFFCSMVCHGELFRLRPESSHLTAYYLAISAGGAIGGILVAVVAPLIFRVYHELHLGLLASAAVVMMAQQGLKSDQHKRRRIWVTALVIVGAIGIVFQGRKSVKDQTAIVNARNFFGVLTVWEEAPQDPKLHKLLLQHGTTFHGLQFQAPAKKLLPTAYYSPTSGIGRLLDSMPKQDHRRIGIVGLGVGTIAIYGKPTDQICFYEINPEVERLARKYFTYLSASKANVQILLGDARLTLENQPPQQYDVLVLDAFSSDSVPVHLLTKEALEIYLKQLGDDGVLAFHISSNHLNLKKVVWRLAEEFQLHSAWIECDENPQSGTLSSDWILLSRNAAILDTPAIVEAANPPITDDSRVDLWTDDHMNLLQILKKKDE
ncbi:MAG TPA: fused MFS/spermidine synthase [Anaerohalosphaeraceae bacterium]|nr:fused MFS/spermidine synthase [Anaerohalosphaeraceae bacterium]